MGFKSLFTTALFIGGIQIVNAANSISVSFTNTKDDCYKFADNFEATVNQHYMNVAGKEHLFHPYGT